MIPPASHPQCEVTAPGALGEGFEVAAGRVEVLVAGGDHQRVAFARGKRPSRYRAPSWTALTISSTAPITR